MRRASQQIICSLQVCPDASRSRAAECLRCRCAAFGCTPPALSTLELAAMIACYVCAMLTFPYTSSLSLPISSDASDVEPSSSNSDWPAVREACKRCFCRGIRTTCRTWKSCACNSSFSDNNDRLSSRNCDSSVSSSAVRSAMDCVRPLQQAYALVLSCCNLPLLLHASIHN